jgi:hypothetical protein
MPSTVQSTTISGNIVEIIIADGPDPELAKFWLKYSTSIGNLHEKTLGEIQLAALRALRNEVGEQIQAIAHIPDQGL